MKAILMALLVLALGASGVYAAGPLGDDASTERTIPLITSTESGTTSTTTTTETGEDVPGPCDEPEHANDPRCTGDGEDAGDDRRGSNSGPGGFEDSGSGSSGHGGSDDDSRSGSNSGSG
jgi:hypothetical protein